MFHRGRGTPLFAAHGKSGLLRYILCSLICVLRDLSYRTVLLVPLPRTRGLRPSLIARLSTPRPFPRKDRRETRGIRLFLQREKQTKLGEIVFAIGPRLPSLLASTPRPFLPRCSRFYAANSFSARMKEKLPVAVDDRHQNEKISLQIYVFWAYFISMRDSQVI